MYFFYQQSGSCGHQFIAYQLIFFSSTNCSSCGRVQTKDFLEELETGNKKLRNDNLSLKSKIASIINVKYLSDVVHFG
jgi:hypothetical protein